MPDRLPRRRRPLVGGAVVEFIRLAVVVLATAIGYELADPLPTATVIVLSAATGYVLGGIFGRFTVRRIEVAERRLRAIGAAELLSGALGGLVGFVLGAGLVWPLLLFGATLVTVPVAALVVTITAAAGMRIGLARGGDLLRYVGATGRLEVTSPGSGARAKVVDTSALIDGRLLDVCRAGFLEGTLLLARFVLYELQGLADSGDDERRTRGRRGLDVLAALERSAGVALEVTERDFPDVTEIDAKLVALARERQAALVTVDTNLASVAELQGVRVLNLHRLAEALRPPVLPGEHVRVRIVKAGREPGQGVGYLQDGTMVVVERSRDRQGDEVAAEVTSVLSNPHGRMVFATLLPPLRDTGTGG